MCYMTDINPWYYTDDSVTIRLACGHTVTASEHDGAMDELQQVTFWLEPVAEQRAARHAIAGCDAVISGTRQRVEWCETHGSRFLGKVPDKYSMCLWMQYEDNWNALPEPEACRHVSKWLSDV